jgi:hypothetical protein
MLLVFGCHDYGNGYFYRVRIWLSDGNSCCSLSKETLKSLLKPPNSQVCDYLECEIAYNGKIWPLFFYRCGPPQKSNSPFH